MARRPTREELELWRSAMAGVRQLHGADAQDAEPEPEAAAPEPSGFAEAMDTPPPRRAAPAPAPRPAPPPPLAPGESSGVDRRTAERVRKGKLPVEATLDLHGLRQADAHYALAGFVERCHRDGRRLVLVITGKGTMREDAGILRTQLPRWLNEPALRDKVLSLHPAQRRHGGEGAFYVFLKRRREG